MTVLSGRDSCVCVLMALLLTGIAPASAGDSYDLAFATYFGGRDWEHARDVAVDAEGNIYVVGGTASVDFPTTPGVYSRTLHADNTQSFGPCDVFVTKFASEGRLLWSTLIGGPAYDRAYGVEIDKDGLVCVAGRAGPGFPVKNAFQPEFNGVDNGSYGMQNAFVLKLRPDGSDLVWSSYVGVSTLCRDIAVDPNGDVYVPGGRWNTTKTPPAEWFANAFQREPPGGQDDCGIIKIKGDGSRVLWATWLGGSGEDQSAASIRVGTDGKVFIGGSTFSEDFPTSDGAFDRTYNGQADFFVACLTPDGSKLVYGTYLGGDGNEWISTHNLAVDAQGNAYVAVPTSSMNYPITQGAFQSNRGGNTDWAISKFSPAGTLLASTLVGGRDDENADGVYVDLAGNVFVTGETKSVDFPVIACAYQPQSGGGTDAAIILLSADFSRLLYATYLGGPANDNGRSGFLGADGSFYVVGASDGTGWPVKNAHRAAFGGGGGNYGNGDCILAKLAPAPPDNQAPSTPTDLVASRISSSQVTLTWTPSADNVAVSGYKVYRDGIRIGFSSAVSFVDVQVETGKSYAYEVSAYDPAGNESFRSAALVVVTSKPDIKSDLLGYWKFDESAGNVAIDASDYAHNGTIFKAVRVPGQSGRALDFGGAGNYVQIQSDGVLDNLQAVTMTAWIYPRVDAHWHVLDKGDGDKRLYAEGTRLSIDGRVRYSGTHAYSASASSTVVLNTWQHVAMVWSRTTNRTRLYHNGVEVRYDIQEMGSGTPQDDTDYPFTIGARGALGDVTFFDGLMDEVRLYNRALSAQEIADLCGEAALPRPQR